MCPTSKRNYWPYWKEKAYWRWHDTSYSILFKGKVGPDVARFGEVYGEVAAKKIPTFFEELAQLKVNSGYEDFVQFIENKETEIRELVDKYSTLEGISERPDLYFDFE